MKDKIEQARAVIERALANCRRPAVMWSSGKDSMALLHLIQFGLGMKLPVIHHRDPFFPKRYQFANGIIADWNLTVYDWAPRTAALVKANGHLSIMEYYQIGPVENCALPVDLYEPDDDLRPEEYGTGWVCGLHDVLYRPKGGINYPWDLVFHGHKSSDTDPLYGAVPLTADAQQTPGAPLTVFPLREWTDADVWEYLQSHDVPWQTDRYVKVKGSLHEREDKTGNPDYLPGCTRCMDRENPATVFCPKLGMSINNVGARLDYQPVPRPDYLGA